MFKIIWDNKTGGVKLQSYITNETLGISPRPVFFEELDLLGLDKLGWSYPRCEEPLLWAINKQYWYRGELMFEAKGANVYDAATVIFQPGKEKAQLKPVDVKAMLKQCKEPMFLLESEAIEFIHETFNQYAGARKIVKEVEANQLDYEVLRKRAELKSKQKMAIVKEDCDSFDIMPLEAAEEQGKKIFHTTKIDRFLASFSGGKDSQVVLDLCTRAIPSTEFEVIYSDTGYELPPSLKLYEEVQEYYHTTFPDLKFSTARNHESVLNYWDKIGTPSDKHRWCCAVMKTAPLYRLLKKDDNKQARVLTFEGVRAEESVRRSGYDRIGRGVKHDTVINARPILNWNTTEIFLYLLKQHLPINIAYRQGMTRVGCLVCPFANEWNEMIACRKYPQEATPFINRIETFAKKAGIKDIKQYVAEGGWKRRASGNLVDQNSFITFRNDTNSNLIAIISNPKVSPLTFLTTIGSYTTMVEKKTIRGELNINKQIYNFSLSQEDNKYTFTIDNISDVLLIGLIKRALYKSTYCIQCEACEVECPTGALSIYPVVVQVDSTKCIHCHKCLEFHDKGCIAANSLILTTGNMNTKTGNIDRYKNFGLREEWLNDYLLDMDDYWTSSHGLNENYQIPSLKAWLRDAEIIDDKNNITELGKLLASDEVRMDYQNLIWEIIWTNLSHKSFIINWFVNNTHTNVPLSQKILEELIREQFPVYKEKTVHNAVYQLRRTLKESPIGNMFSQHIEIDKENFKREEYLNLSCEALAYSIYKYADAKGIRSLRIADFYQQDSLLGPAKEFGISKSTFERLLRQLNSNPNRVLIAELNMGLDSITLRDDLTAYKCLEQLLK